MTLGEARAIRYNEMKTISGKGNKIQQFKGHEQRDACNMIQKSDYTQYQTDASPLDSLKQQSWSRLCEGV